MRIRFLKILPISGLCMFLCALGGLSCTSSNQGSSSEAPTSASDRALVEPDDVPRISVTDARQRVQAGQALLVCAYESDDAFAQSPLEGAISYSAFMQRKPKLDKEQQLIFYCG